MSWSKRAEQLLISIWILTLIATMGSLFYSEVMRYTPCELCWIQRIFMYPLVIIYGAALVKKNIQIALPGLLLSGLGFLVSVYHYSLQKLSGFDSGGAVCGDVPCTLQYVNYVGFITIPFLAGIAFLIIFVLHWVVKREGKRQNEK